MPRHLLNSAPEQPRAADGGARLTLNAITLRFRRELRAARKRIAELADDSAAALAQEPSLARAVKELGNALENLKTAQEEFDRQNQALTADYEKLEAENRRYRDLFELAPLPYLVTDAEGNILEANQAAGSLLNTPPGVSRRQAAARLCRKGREK